MKTILLLAALSPFLFAAISSPLDFKMRDLGGKEVDLAKWKGKVVLMVNVASQCGYTPQYEDLQKLYDKYKEKGLVVVGVPANEFGAQEPGSNEEIRKFCTEKFKVSFPMLAKIVVKGEGIHPLYKFLTEKESNPQFAGEVKWNFTKFLVGRDAKVAGRFESKMKPMGKELTEAVEKALAAPVADR